MLPLWRGLPLVTRNVSCRTSPVKRLYAYAASPLNEPLSDFQTGSADSAGLASQSVQVTHPDINPTRQHLNSVHICLGKVSTLQNGLKVVSLETYSPKSRVGLFINAASRHETPITLGITHMLRNAAFLGNDERSGFIIARELEHSGASLEEFVVTNLASIVNKPAFYPWELDEPMKHLKIDLAMKDTQTQINVVEELHRVAYRKTLGNSLYCLPHRTGTFTPDLLRSHTSQNYVGQRMALVGVGVDHDKLVALAEASLAFLPEGSTAPKEATKYHGGEVMNFRPGPLLHAVLATEGPSLGSKDFLAFSVYQKLLGVTPYIKWGSNIATNRLLKAAAESTGGACAASAFSASYSDSGLFGCYVVTEAANAPKVMKAVVDQFAKASKGDISDKDVERAKNQMKAHLLMNSECQDTLFDDIGSQVLTKGSYTSPAQVAASVDSITKNDILTVAKRVFSGKPTLSAAGDISSMPGLDELF